MIGTLQQIDSVALVDGVTMNQTSSIWMWIAIIEGIIILLGFIFHKYSKTQHYQIKAKALQDDVDLDNIFNSAFNAKPLYQELARKCHPDRFAPDEAKMQIADNLFQRITKNQNNIKELLSLKQEAQERLNIK